MNPLMAERRVVNMRDMQASANGGGLACPSCGCCDSRVTRTTRGDGIIVRERVCRHCGAKRPTFETG